MSMNTNLHVDQPPAMQKRFPLPLVPNGWYGLLRSHELKRGQVVPLRAFDRELVAFRDESGRAAVLDAYCPHLGAHLGYGGQVKEGCVECPYHKWRFASDGHCTHAVGPERGHAVQAPRVRVGSWSTDEVDGVVFVWHHASGLAPSWQMPRFPTDGTRYSRPLEIRYRLAAHIQELRENLGDETHFTVIHGWPVHRGPEFDAQGPLATSRFSSSVGLGNLRLKFDAEVAMAGPGVSHLRVFGFAPSRVTMLTTPIDAQHSELRFLVAAGDLQLGHTALPLSRLLLSRIVRRITTPDVNMEEMIWNHKVYLPRPVFLPHEQTQRKIRNWYKQFYESEPPLRS